MVCLPVILHSILRNGFVWLCSSAFATNVRFHLCRRSSSCAHIQIVTVIPSDYSEQLTYLLRYPSSPSSSSSSSNSSTIHHATLLLRQALTLQMSPSPSTGVSVIYENRNLLGIPTEVPEPPPPPPRRRPRPSDRGQSFSANIASRREQGSTSKSAHARQQSTPMGLPEMFARGLLERGESLGINKTVMNAVSELKVGSLCVPNPNYR